MTYESKGYAVAALVEALKKRGLLERVAERVSPSARALLTHPPSATSWTDGKKVSEIYVVIDAIVGEAEVRKIGHEVTSRGAVVLLRPVVEGFLRLFGGTPSYSQRPVASFFATPALHSHVPSGRQVPWSEEIASLSLHV
jgi:hypothetical protein